MKIVFHEDFKRTDYATDGASVPGRMECIMEALVEEGRYDVISPELASSKD
ncbi:histone deacetylase family protein, partial [Methanosarcinales archaeon]